MSDSQDDVLAAVEAFLAETGINPTSFGQRAVNDPRFVFDLRGGRECRRATREKVRDFIERHRSAATRRGRARSAA